MSFRRCIFYFENNKSFIYSDIWFAYNVHCSFQLIVHNFTAHVALDGHGSQKILRNVNYLSQNSLNHPIDMKKNS